MATQIRVSVVGLPELRRRLEKMNPGTNKRILRESLKEAAELVQKNAARVQIMGGGGGAKSRKAGTAKPPTQPPTRLFSRSGLLRGSIAVDLGPLPFAIEVGSNEVYAPLHEFGLGRMPKRAFMAPALDEVAPKFGDIVIKRWKREAGL